MTACKYFFQWVSYFGTLTGCQRMDDGPTFPNCGAHCPKFEPIDISGTMTTTEDKR